jgi:hypothetical protein
MVFLLFRLSLRDAAIVADGAEDDVVVRVQCPKALVDALPATTEVLQHYVTTRSPVQFVRALWILG